MTEHKAAGAVFIWQRMCRILKSTPWDQWPRLLTTGRTGRCWLAGITPTGHDNPWGLPLVRHPVRQEGLIMQPDANIRIRKRQSVIISVVLAKGHLRCVHISGQKVLCQPSYHLRCRLKVRHRPRCRLRCLSCNSRSETAAISKRCCCLRYHRRLMPPPSLSHPSISSLSCH